MTAAMMMAAAPMSAPFTVLLMALWEGVSQSFYQRESRRAAHIAKGAMRRARGLGTVVRHNSHDFPARRQFQEFSGACSLLTCVVEHDTVYCPRARPRDESGVPGRLPGLAESKLSSLACLPPCHPASPKN